MEVIEAFGFSHSGIKRDDFLQVDHVIQLGREPNRIDILTGISGVTFDEAWGSREQGNISDSAVFVISRDLLIKNKRAANRDKDQADIKLLEKNQAATLLRSFHPTSSPSSRSQLWRQEVKLVNLINNVFISRTPGKQPRPLPIDGDPGFGDR